MYNREIVIIIIVGSFIIIVVIVILLKINRDLTKYLFSSFNNVINLIYQCFIHFLRICYNYFNSKIKRLNYLSEFLINNLIKNGKNNHIFNIFI